MDASSQQRTIKMIRKISNRLEAFLLVVADKLDGHELLHEFLQAEDLDREAINARAVLKSSFYEDMLVETHSSTVADLPMTLARFDTKSKETEGLLLGERKFADLIRRSSNANITISRSTSELAFLFHNPTTSFFYVNIEPHFTILAKFIKKLAADELALSHRLLDQNFSLAAGVEGILYFQVLASEFTTLEKHTHSLHEDLKRLAKRATSPSAKQLELVGDIDEAFNSFSSASNQLRKKGCKLNSVAASLNSDLNQLEAEHYSLLIDVLDNHAQNNIIALESTFRSLTMLEKSIY